jgi:hypothetical protein
MLVSKITIIYLEGLFMTDILPADDYVGMSFWLISMALVAATAFFFIERDRVHGKWKTSLTVSGLLLLKYQSVFLGVY